MFRTFPRLTIPNDVLSFEGEKFLELINQTCGNAMKDLMQILSIDTVYKLLLVEKDVLAILEKNCRELEKVTERICLHLDDGKVMVKPGIRLDFNRLIEALHSFIDQNRQREQTTNSDNNLVSLIKTLMKSSNSNEPNDAQDNYSFLIALLENIYSNLTKNKNNYRYTEVVQHFAQALFIIAGRNAYEFVRLNLPGALPALSTLNDSLIKAGVCVEEGEFRYDTLREHQKSSNYEIAVCSEDSTGVIKKITYNAATNTFTGFSAPLKRGIPISHHFQTNSFDQLREWFDDHQKSNLLNIHMVQPLTTPALHLSPFLLSAYGINNTFKAVDVLNRWIWILENSMKSNVRIVAFSTDCDPRYLLAMRLATGFFARYLNTSIQHRNDALEIPLQKHWSTWFYMEKRQLFFSFQDPVHLCTKLRNRILSETCTMVIGKEAISIDVLITLIQNKSKLVHGLVRTDIDPKDKQNFTSCLKLSADDVFVALDDVDDSNATRIYLQIIRSIVLAYIEHDTPILDRIYFGWLAVFLCRIWQTWLFTVDKTRILAHNSGKKPSDLFITTPAHFSIELNAHTLLAICLLVKQNQLPESALSISKYHSQSCESTFRLTRSMSGAFSSIVNFTIEQFLKRAGKLSVLTEIETKSESGQLECPLQFPKHHKRRRKRMKTKISSSSSSIDLLIDENIETTIYRAFDDAYDLLSKVDVDVALERKKRTTIHHVSSFVQNQFQQKFKKVWYDDEEVYSSDDDDYDYYLKYNIDLPSKSEENDSSEEEDDLPNISACGKSQFRGIRIFDTIPSSSSNSFFRVEIDGNQKYIHKQTACWLLTDEKAGLSADRLKRVQQSSR